MSEKDIGLTRGQPASSDTTPAATPIERLLSLLELAESGSDALDHEILAVFGRSADYEAEGNFGGYRILPSYQRFSRSVDAALTLTHGRDIDERDLWDDCGEWFVMLRTLVSGGRILEWKAQSHDPALAFCTAAVHALKDEPYP